MIKHVLKRGEPQQFTIKGKGALELSINWVAFGPIGARVELQANLTPGHYVDWGQSQTSDVSTPILIFEGSNFEVVQLRDALGGIGRVFEVMEVTKDYVVLDVESGA